MKKRIIAISLIVAMLAVAIIGGSLAYFTDTDAATNTFTVGNVDIDLIESQYHRTNAGQGYTTKLEPTVGGYIWARGVALEGTPENTPNYTTSGETWTGSYFSDAQLKADAAAYADYFAAHGTDMVPGVNVRKNPYVINTGSNDAYVRVRVLIPVTLFDVIKNGASEWNARAINKAQQITSNAVAAYNAGNYQSIPTVTRGDIEYYVYDFTYVKALKPGDMTFWNCWCNIAIDKNATSAQLAGVDSFDVIIEADAIQAQGFADATAAFAAFDTNGT